MGETADRFVREADSNSENKCPELSEAMELAISNMLESSRNFRFQQGYGTRVTSARLCHANLY